MSLSPRFSKDTLKFLLKASRQRHPQWLDRNREEYEALLLKPLQHLAQSLKQGLAQDASDYHFPLKGIGRLRRPAHRIGEGGGGMYKNWMAYSASRPTESRFDSNPNLFFLLNPEDAQDPVLVAGGLYNPSSRQLRSVREAIASDDSGATEAFEALFRSKAFAKRFVGGFSRDKISKRPPRGFDPEHPRMAWLKLQAFFVWRPYTLKEFGSKDFADLVLEDWEQILRLNRLLEQAIQGRVSVGATKPPAGKGPGLRTLADRLEQVEAPLRPAHEF